MNAKAQTIPPSPSFSAVWLSIVSRLPIVTPARCQRVAPALTSRSMGLPCYVGEWRRCHSPASPSLASLPCFNVLFHKLQCTSLWPERMLDLPFSNERLFGSIDSSLSDGKFKIFVNALSLQADMRYFCLQK
ncbi:hypothetical protein O6H91_Y497700 [Diphasiastrum complanatum]|nr:hypothetical protein O6H91_Y497700 [Diphasiastrum complanatum]